jgi:ABC-type transport system involved in cytochrome bd biosynthesis fused ATPase/permease subunit
MTHEIESAHSGRALVRALALAAGPRLALVSALHTLWWTQAPLALALSAPVWLPLAIGAALSPLRMLAQQSLRASLRDNALAHSAARALRRPRHAVPESDAEAAFWSAHIAEYAVSTTVPLAVATAVTLALSLALVARALGATITLALLSLLAIAAIATLLSTRALSPRATAAVDARQHAAVWLAAALRGGSEIRGPAAHRAYLAHVRDAVLAWCRAENGFELRRDLSRIAIVLLATLVALRVAPSLAPSLQQDLSQNLPSTVALVALFPAGYGALRAASDLWVTFEELRRLDAVLGTDAPRVEPPRALPARPEAIVAEGVALRYGEHLAFRADSLRIPLDSLTLVTGPNGAGKSTLAAAIVGVLAPSEGVLAFECAGERVPCGAILREQTALVPQEPTLIETLSIRENMTLAAPTASDAQLRAALARVGVERALEHRAGELSRGQRQRVGLARALLTNPLLLVLDEPDAWLDAAGRALLLSVLREESQRRAVLVVSHRDELRAIAGTVLAIDAEHRASIA